MSTPSVSDIERGPSDTVTARVAQHPSEGAGRIEVVVEVAGEAITAALPRDGWPA